MLANDIKALLKGSPYHCKYTQQSIDRCIMPAIGFKKYMTYYDDGKLVGFLSWAFLYEHQVDGYLNKSRNLKPIDFMRNQGELWFIDFIAPYGNVRTIIREFQKEFQTRYPDIKFGKMFRRAKGYDARVIVRTK